MSEQKQTPLLPDEIREKLPPLYANEEIGLLAVALVKFSTLSANWTWYATEFDGQDIFFGYVIGHYPELGYFSLSELESVGSLIERDLNFEPKTLQEIIDYYEKNNEAL